MADSRDSHPIERHLKKFKRYQLYVMAMVFLSKMPIFWHILNLMFLSPDMNYECQDEGGGHNTCPCNDPKWDTSVFTLTIQMRFKLLCETKWLTTLSQSMTYVGMVIGAFVFGYLCDRLGRVLSVSISCMLLFVFGLALAFVPNIYAFIVVRLIEGAGAGGAIITTYVLVIEYCGVHQKELITALFHIPLNLGQLFIPLISFLIRDYRYFQVAVSAPLLIFGMLKLFVKDSPRWLLDKGRYNEVAIIMKKLSPSENQAELRRECEAFASQSHAAVNKLKFWQIFKHKRLTINFIVMAINYFMCGIGYYGVSQFISKMSDQVHINVALSGLMLLPGTLSTVWLLKILSRRTFLMSSNVIGGVLMLIVIAIPASVNLARVIIACCSLTCFFVSFIIIFLYAVELFPTVIRSSALGLLSVISRLATILGPPLNSLSQTVAASSYGVLAIVAGGLCFFLPVTNDMVLPTTLEDLGAKRSTASAPSGPPSSPPPPTPPSSPPPPPSATAPAQVPPPPPANA